MTNETDRELLELAAKAAGYDLEFLCDMPHMIVEEWGGDTSQHPEQRAIEWSPLTEDGDALRLACVLSLMVDAHHERAISGDRYCDGFRDWVYSDGSTFGIAAIRRAIVRAAAEIGKSMP